MMGLYALITQAAGRNEAGKDQEGRDDGSTLGPRAVCRFDDQPQLSSLIFQRNPVPDDGRCKSALWTEGETLQGNKPGGFLNSGD